MAMPKPIMATSGKIDVASNAFNPLQAAHFLLVSIPAAHAFKLVPIRVEFEPTGRGVNQTFRLENESSNSVPVQLSMLTRQMDLDGNETNAPAEDDFLVYPPQILLKPNQV